MNGYVSRNPLGCSTCIMSMGVPHVANWPLARPCSFHAAADGSFKECDTHDAYNPTDDVKDVIGCFMTGHDGPYRCIGYDRRCGFWVMNLSTGSLHNISERAVGRTFHVVHDAQPRHNEAPWVRVGPIARKLCGQQAQYVSRWIDGECGSPNYGRGLRFKGDPRMYHQVMIHEDDIEAFVTRVMGDR